MVRDRARPCRRRFRPRTSVRTGGWAYGYHRTHGTLTAINTVGAPIESAFSSSKFMSGWTIGGGVEWAFADHWSAKFEYLYIDFGRLDNINLALAGAPRGELSFPLI